MDKFSKERHKTIDQLNPSPKNFSFSLPSPKALRESLEPLLSSGTRSARRKSTNISTQINFQRERKNRKEREGKGREGKGRELDYCLPGRPKYLIEQPLPRRRGCLARARKPCLSSCSSLLPVFASLLCLLFQRSLLFLPPAKP